MEDVYAKLGTEVILGRHTRNGRYGLEWEYAMERYVGRKTRITNSRTFSDKMVLCRVECDNGRFLWRAEDMILASDVPLLTEAEKTRRKIR